MKRILFSLALLTSALVYADAPKAETTKNIAEKTAVVDFSGMVNFQEPKESALLEGQESLGALQSELEKRRVKIQDKQAKAEKEFSEIKSPEKIDKATEEKFNRIGQELQREVQESQQYMQQELAKIQTSISDKVEAAAKEIALAQGYTHVARKEAFIYVNDSYDITKQVVDILNRKYQAEQRAKKVVKTADKK